MKDALELFQNKQLIVRAMDAPTVNREDGNLIYDCSVWAGEFELMQMGNFSSVSSTLIIPSVPVHLYKNIGFLVNANTADCFHICKTDSGSSGNILDGDFFANEADFATIAELAEYIESANATDMNEVNLNLKLSDVVGLVITKCPNEIMLLKRMLVVRSALEQLTGIQYPIYEYDGKEGRLVEIELTDELLQSVEDFSKSSISDGSNAFCYYTDSSDEVFYGNIKNIKKL